MIKLLAALLFAFASGSAALAQQSVFVPATTNQIPIAGTVAASTQIVAGVAGKRIYVTAVALVPLDTASVLFTYGTGTNCGTGTTNITGTMVFEIGKVLSLGVGNGAVWVLPPGNSLCITVAVATAPGSLAYAIF